MMRKLPAMFLATGALGAAACAGDDAPLELPTPMEQESPFVYPEALWDEDVEGQAVVMLHVSEEGLVDSVYVRSTSGYAEMDSAALAGARTLRFHPGMRGEEPVEVWIRLPVRFSKTPPDEQGNREPASDGAGGAT